MLRRALLLAAALFGGAPAGWAASVFERVEIQPSSRGTVVRMEFVAPMRYLSHTPEKRGNELRILLRPINQGEFDPDALFGRETLGWSLEQSSVARGLVYDGTSSAQPRMLLTFHREAEFLVRTSPDQRSLVVIILPRADKPTPPRPVAARPRPPPPVPAAPAPAETGYVVHLYSDTRPIDPARIRRLPAFGEARLFVTENLIEGRRWYRLNLGYFATAAAAKGVVERVRRQYPNAWISRERIPAAAPALAAPPAAAPAPHAAATVGERERVAQLLARGRQAMTDGQYGLAVQLFTSLLEVGAGEADSEARELLGLARERNGQFAHAIAEYEDYLGLYPSGPDADRVRQRLAGLLTARPMERETAAAEDAPDGVDQRVRWNWSGSLSQYYFRDENLGEVDGEKLNQSDLSTWLTFTSRRRGPRLDMRLQVSAGNEQDYVAPESSEDLVFNDLYLDLIDKRSRVSARFGRQRQTASGTFGRFDGMTLGYQWLPTVRLNLLAGYPVNLTEKTVVQSDQPFVGVNAGLGPYAEHWSFNAYAVEQEFDGFTDRRAVGGELRYLDPQKSLFVLADYDTEFEQTNTFLLLGNWTVSDDLSLYLTLDERYSPPLGLRNASARLVSDGSLIADLETLHESFSAEQVQQFALDRTARTRTLSLGGTGAVRERLQLSLDLTASETDATVASGNVESLPASGVDYFYTLQLLGEEFLFPAGTSILTLRYADTSSSEIYGAILDYRRRLPRQWRLNPRIDLEYREQVDSEDTATRVRPVLGLEYLGWRQGLFEADLGLNWLETKDEADTVSSTTLVLNLGYRWDF